MAIKTKKKPKKGKKVKASAKTKAKKAKSKPKKTKKAEKPKRGAPIGRRKGATLGLGVHDTWIHLFEENERRANKKGKKKPRTDVEICQFMVDEFGYRAVYEKVQSVRTKYNRGGLSRGEVPEIQSVRYGPAKRGSILDQKDEANDEE